jgi:hypothetical protein
MLKLNVDLDTMLIGAEINIQVNRTEKISELRGEGNERNNSKHGRYSFKYFCGKW